MANITTYLSNILSAVFGEEVRSSIHDAISAINDESSDARKAATDAQNSAANSAEAAKISELNAESSASSALAYSDNAAKSATEAKNAEDNAKESETAAKESETNARNSAEVAKDSEDDTKGSETAAKESETNARNSAAAAKDSEDNAASSEKSAIKSASASEDFAKLSESYAHGVTGVRDGEETDNSKYYYNESIRFRDESRKYMEQASAAVNGPSTTILIQVPEPSINNCLWIKPLNVSIADPGTVMLELSDDLNSSNYYAEIDGNLKAIENIVDSEDELTESSYLLEIT